MEDPGKDLDKDALGSFPRSFRIFNLRIKGSFVYLGKIFIDRTRLFTDLEVNVFKIFEVSL